MAVIAPAWPVESGAFVGWMACQPGAPVCDEHPVAELDDAICGCPCCHQAME
jgi:hypothetical protein